MTNRIDEIRARQSEGLQTVYVMIKPSSAVVYEHIDADADIDWLISEVDRLSARVRELEEGLRTLEWTPCEDYCEIGEHDSDTEDCDDQHHRSCMACGWMECLGHKPDCWLARLLGADQTSKTSDELTRWHG